MAGSQMRHAGGMEIKNPFLTEVTSAISSFFKYDFAINAVTYFDQRAVRTTLQREPIFRTNPTLRQRFGFHIARKPAFGGPFAWSL